MVSNKFDKIIILETRITDKCKADDEILESRIWELVNKFIDFLDLVTETHDYFEAWADVIDYLFKV